MSAAEHVDHVGSLLRPPALTEAWFAHEQGKLSAEKLAALAAKCEALPSFQASPLETP